jgi:hypothetical protein
MGIPLEALILAGFVLAHAAWSVSDVAPGELLVPLAIVESAGQRQLTRFEAETQEAAIDRGKQATAEATKTAKAWAFAREGLMPVGGRKVDVLVVEFWAQGMSQPAVLLQQFQPVKADQAFRLIGEPQVAVSGKILDSAAVRPLLEQVQRGVNSHGRVAPLWVGWH